MSVVDSCHLPVDGGDAVFCEVTGDGPPLVLTHDAILHRASWDAQFESLSGSFRVVRWDQRGFGRSGEHDVADVHAHCGAIQAGIPGATRLVLPNSGHLPHFEAPGEFGAAVLGFLTAQRQRAEHS